MSYVKHFKELMDKKQYAEMNSAIGSNPKYLCDGQIKVTKRMANKLTIPTIVRLGFEWTSALKYIPESNNQIINMLVDFLLDFKLDKEYKKPSYKVMDTIYACFSTRKAGYYFLNLFSALGFTKQDLIKHYKEFNPYNWLNIVSMLSGKDKIKDDEVRKMIRGKATMYMKAIKKYNEKEVKQLPEIGYASYELDSLMENSPERFPEKILLQHVLHQAKANINCRSYRKTIEYLQKHSKEYDANTIFDCILSGSYWYYSSNKDATDTKLATVLKLVESKDVKTKINVIEKHYKLA